MKGVGIMTTKDYYEAYKEFTLDELKAMEHKSADKLSSLYHTMSLTIRSDDEDAYKKFNEETIEEHNKLSSIRILINHKENGLI